MLPELFEIPGTNLTVKSYGVMLVIGFLAAVWIIRRLSKKITPDPQLITNAALYALIAGVLGARTFYVIHYFEQFRYEPMKIFAIWQGGLELLGGVLLAILVILLYMRYHKLPIRKYLDILAIALMLALAIGRIGCFLNGCCYGKPTGTNLGIKYPYGSLPYLNQVYPDPERGRDDPYIDLPPEYFGYVDSDGVFTQAAGGALKPYELLDADQRFEVTLGKYRALPIHPTQLYTSVAALIMTLILFTFWRRHQSPDDDQKPAKIFSRDGCTFSLMFILYGIMRFLIEYVRDDNPFEYQWWTIYKGGTISQNICIYLMALGLVLFIMFASISAPRPQQDQLEQEDKKKPQPQTEQ
jgi:phosphatidylglycerol:prolipoprotein diacylglycerol transferase